MSENIITPIIGAVADNILAITFIVALGIILVNKTAKGTLTKFVEDIGSAGLSIISAIIAIAIKIYFDYSKIDSESTISAIKLITSIIFGLSLSSTFALQLQKSQMVKIQNVANNIRDEQNVVNKFINDFNINSKKLNNTQTSLFKLSAFNKNVGTEVLNDYLNKFAATEDGFYIDSTYWALNSYEKFWKLLAEKQKNENGQDDKKKLIARITHSNDINLWLDGTDVKNALRHQKSFITNGGVIVRILIGNIPSRVILDFFDNEEVDEIDEIDEEIEVYINKDWRNRPRQESTLEIDVTNPATLADIKSYIKAIKTMKDRLIEVKYIYQNFSTQSFDFCWIDDPLMNTENIRNTRNTGYVVKWYSGVRNQLSSCHIVDKVDDEIIKEWRVIADKAELDDSPITGIPEDRRL